MQHSLMEPAISRFFSLPELVTHLAQYLDQSAISKCMQTNQHLKTLFTPALYYGFTIESNTYRQQLFDSAESTRALARNVRHARCFGLGILEVVYFANCIIAFQDQQLTQTHNTATEELIKDSPLQQQRPLWLAPPDPLIHSVIPIPPVMLLTKLEISANYEDNFHNCHYVLPNFKDPKMVLTYICWIMNLNPHLQDLSLSNLIIKDMRDLLLVTTSIFELKKLRRLAFDAFEWPLATYSKLSTTIFFSCPPFLQELQLELKGLHSPSHHISRGEYIRLEPGILQSWEKSDEELGLLTTTVPRRPEILTHLTRLDLGDIGRGRISEEEFRVILANCPNITDMTIPNLSLAKDVQHFAQEVVKLCPKLAILHKNFYCDDLNVYELLVGIMQELPPQQATHFEWPNRRPFAIDRLNDAGSFIRRQSRTLRVICLAGCENFDSKAVQIILCECAALEELHADRSPFDIWYRTCISLEDAIEFPWACDRLRLLKLTVAIPDQPLHRPNNDTILYYNRPPPVTLSAAEKHQFGQLEAFYRQIGALTHLQSLRLQAVLYDPDHQNPMSAKSGRGSFPSMLNLPSESIGLPGYLSYLGGLTKLKRLEGSVFAESEVNKIIIGMDEVVWMDEHWPELQLAEFCRRNCNLPEQFKWFKDRREKRGRRLYLHAQQD